MTRIVKSINAIPGNEVLFLLCQESVKISQKVFTINNKKFSDTVRKTDIVAVTLKRVYLYILVQHIQKIANWWSRYDLKSSCYSHSTKINEGAVKCGASKGVTPQRDARFVSAVASALLILCKRMHEICQRSQLSKKRCELQVNL